jgi:hypothetical protein
MEDDDFSHDEVRSPQEIARRSLALFGVYGLAVGAPRDEVLEWLEHPVLREALSPNERTFIDNERPSENQTIDFSWHAERLIVLLWALNLVEDLPGADEQCDDRVFQRCLPPYTEQSVEQFILNASLRNENELWEEAERTLALHWRARKARQNYLASQDTVDIEVAQERHHASNWVTGYCGLEWDDVTTDT